MTTNIYIKKTSLIILIIIALIGKAFSATNNAEVNGMVKDSITGEGLPFASVQLLSQSDSTLIKATLTDVNGNYIIKDIADGKYILFASYMGYYQSEKAIDIQTKRSKYDFLLLPKSFSLSGIEITAEKNLIENSIEKTTINIAQNTTLAGGTAIDVMQTLPSVDVDIDGNVNYRGSDKVIILVNGEESELVKNLDQIPADQIEKIELINNPSTKYEAEGMSGIINIVLKSGSAKKNNLNLMLNLAYPLIVGGNVGYTRTREKTRFFINAGLNHKDKYQTKEHLRKNYENPTALNYYQFDRQDESLNNAFINTSFEYAISKKQHINLSLISTKKWNTANREIRYETQNESGYAVDESLKEIDILFDNYTIDGNLNYRYNFNKSKHFLKTNFHYSFLDQMQQMNNEFFPELNIASPDLQNTFLEQLNQKADFSLDYSLPITDSILFETGYNFSTKDFLNDFYSESYNYTVIEWIDDAALANKFNYIQQINAVYFNLSAKLKFLELQAGVRAEYTTDLQNNNNANEYIDFFPSVNISKQINNHFIIFAACNRRINRPTIKMLNPFTDEYADILNMHIGNPDLKPEYVNSYELGNRFTFNKFSGFASVYFRDIDQAISRIKSATNDSALVVSFMNLDKAKLLGGEFATSYKPYKWWNINIGANIFYTSLTGVYENNDVNNTKIAWSANVQNKFKIYKDLGLQLSCYYRSKLPSVMGIYTERYYMDIAINKKILKNKGQLIFKITDVFNTYKFGLDLDAIDDNNYRYSQTNRKKNESRYFMLSFIYNINGKEQQKTKDNFFLDGFDK
jgi:outer membrane receptor protein involved in Fe transport